MAARLPHSKRASDAHGAPVIDTPATVWSGGSDWTAASLKNAIRTGQAAALSVGQIVMLAGDFFESLDEMKIAAPRAPANVMQGVDANARFACMIIDVLSLPHSSYVPFADDATKRAKGQKDFMESVSKDTNATRTVIQLAKVKQIAEAVRELRGSTRYSEIHALAQLIADPNGRRLAEAERLLPWAKAARPHLAGLTVEERNNLETNGFDFRILASGITNGHYLGLALENTPHFDPVNWIQFERYHNEALGLVDQHIDEGGHRYPIPAEAVARTAFGLHFMTDSFSAGHMRVPRAQLGVEGALASKLMHDMDGYYGLQVKDGFGNEWRAYGDGNLRGATLNAIQTGNLDAIGREGKGVNTDGDANWQRVKLAVAAAFKQLHYQAQRHFVPQTHSRHSRVSELQAVLAANRETNGLKWDELAEGRAAEETSLDAALKVSIAGKLAFLRKYQPQPNPVGPGRLENHPPLFSEDGQLNRSTTAYGVTRPAMGNKRVLCLRWHGVTDTSVNRDFSDLYYLARFSVGAAREGWVPRDETRLVPILDGLPEWK